MKTSSIDVCLVTLALVATFLLATAAPTSSKLSATKRSQSEANDTAAIRQAIDRLTSIGIYYQHLLLRGLLSDAEVARYHKMQSLLTTLRSLVGESSR